MLIALDIGNSHVRMGIAYGDEIQFVASIATDERLTKEQYACQIRDVLQLYNVQINQIKGAVLCSVVPAVTTTVQKAIKLLTGIMPLNVASGLKTGSQIRRDNPNALGSDLGANAVFALKNKKLPCIVIDMGTVTTFTVVDKKGTLIGTAIASGVKSSIDTLRHVGAQLPAIRMEAPKKGILGRNTVDAMKSGTIFGAAAMVDGMIDRISDELGEKPYVLLCGGTGEFLAPFITRDVVCDANVTLKGLIAIWHKNQKG